MLIALELLAAGTLVLFVVWRAYAYDQLPTAYCAACGKQDTKTEMYQHQLDYEFFCHECEARA